MNDSYGSVTDKTYQNAGNRDVLLRVPQSHRRVLDIGCGAGDNARVLRAAGHQIVGITLSPDEAELAKDVCDEVIVANVEAGLPPEISDIDVVICSHVLEHICFPENLLADVHGVLNPGGILIVALPNLMFYKTRLPLVLGRFEYAPHGIMDNTHFRWYTFRSAQQMLRTNGFDVTSAAAQGAFPLWPLRRLVPAKTLRPIDQLATRLLPGVFGAQMVFTGEVSARAKHATPSA